jgi:hypothetical protein
MKEKYPKLIIHLGPHCYQYIIIHRDGKGQAIGGPDLIEMLATAAGYDVQRTGNGHEEYSTS